MNSETERNDPVGFGATLGLAEAQAPAVGRNSSFRTRLAQAVGDDRGPEQERDQASPSQRIVATVAVWALVLGLGGIVVGIASLIRFTLGAPGWFQLAIVLLGLLGIGLTVSGFTTVQRRFMPWLMLSAATATLAGIAVLLTKA